MAVDVLSTLFGAGVITAIVAAVKMLPDIRKTNAEAEGESNTAAKVIADTALELLAPLRQEVSTARGEAEAMREQNVRLRVEFAEFRDDVRVMREELAEYHRLYGPLPAA